MIETEREYCLFKETDKVCISDKTRDLRISNLATDLEKAGFPVGRGFSGHDTPLPYVVDEAGIPLAYIGWKPELLAQTPIRPYIVVLSLRDRNSKLRKFLEAYQPRDDVRKGR